MRLFVIGHDHRLVDERSQHLEHVAVERRPGDHGLGRGEIEAPGEHRDSSEHDTFVVVEQFVTPVEGRTHRSVPITSAVAPGHEYIEARCESKRELGQRHRPDVGGGELDRQRNAVHMAADLFDHRPVLGPERGTGVARSVDEQVDGVRLDGQRRYRHDVFALDAEGLAARGKDPQPGAAVQRVDREVNDGVEHVLAVVEHEEHVAVPDALGDGLTSRQPVVCNKAEGGRHERCDVGRIVGISEFHHPHTAGES